VASLQVHTHAETLETIRSKVRASIRGKDKIIDLAIVTILARGHLLIEDVPGVGKSSLARSLARAVGGSFSRIQFTSDLLPADLLGVNVWQSRKDCFSFHEGPVFANVVLADEINRAPPRTQSALLEAMEERQVSIDGTSRALPLPFTVLATQNPQDHHGTYPLPESQRDRFLVRLSMGYAPAQVEAALIQTPATPHVASERADAKSEEPAVSSARLLELQNAAANIFLHADLAHYAQKIVQATRDHPDIQLGVSTRGALAWASAARARALTMDRTQVAIEDLQNLAVPVLAHRLMLTQRTALDTSASAEELVHDLIAEIAVPV